MGRRFPCKPIESYRLVTGGSENGPDLFYEHRIAACVVFVVRVFVLARFILACSCVSKHAHTYRCARSKRGSTSILMNSGLQQKVVMTRPQKASFAPLQVL